MLQPAGLVEVNSGGIKCTDAAFAERFLAFLRLAKTRKANLAICPEYCCPWDTLEAALREDLGPAPGDLWILGCQSITPAEVRTLNDRLPATAVVFDENCLKGDGRFLDPAVLLFRNPDDDAQLILVLQFKTEAMGVSFPTERNDLIRGERGYVVSNEGGASINLVTLICSDSLELSWQTSLPQLWTTPTLVVHLQLNPKPRHPDFSAYRSEALRQVSDEIELMCLNWAAGTTGVIDEGDESPLVQEPHTALYTKSSQLDLRESRLQENHEAGLYFFRWDQKRTTVFVANDDELCFELRLSKPSQKVASALTAKRSGPQDVVASVWNGTGWKPAAHLPDCTDDLLHEARLDSIGPISAVDSRMDLERFLSLSAGEVSRVNWSQPSNLDPCRIETDEVLGRSTCCDNQAGRPRVEKRLAHVRTLSDIFDSRKGFDAPGMEVLQDASLGFDRHSPSLNIHDDQGPIATGAYIGTCVSDEAADRERLKLDSALGGGYRRTFVWYQLSTGIKCAMGRQHASITGVPTSSASITAPARPK
ncbi:MAG: hypothetical protein HKN37_17120 [Rhodothermales bacterium]|nr:hypothetical protein [Rhodothermales bacterium]